MGSAINETHLEEILKVGNHGVLALDRDAYHKAVEYFHKWRLVIPNFRPILLSKDLKHLNDQEIKDLVEKG